MAYLSYVLNFCRVHTNGFFDNESEDAESDIDDVDSEGSVYTPSSRTRKRKVSDIFHYIYTFGFMRAIINIFFRLVLSHYF